MKPLPIERFRFFRQETRTADDAGCVQIDASYYAALPAPLHREVTVRIYEHHIEILDVHGEVLRRHDKATRKGEFVLPEADRIFNPSRETARPIGKVAKIGPHCAQLAREIFARLGRPGQKAIYGLANLTRHHKAEDIERACQKVLGLSQPSYQALKRILEHSAAQAASAAADAPSLQQTGEHIRLIEEYQLSGLQERKDLKDLDWSYNPKLPKRDVLELATLKFIEARDGALLIGPPGVGKSRVAKAIVQLAVQRGYKVFYREAQY